MIFGKKISKYLLQHVRRDMFEEDADSVDIKTDLNQDIKV